MDSKKRTKKIRLIIAIIFLALSLFWAFHAGTAYSENPDCDNPVTSLVLGAVSIFQNPLEFKIYFTLKGVLSLLCVLVIYGFSIFAWSVYEERHAHFKRDIACGSAQWNTDMKAYNKQFTEPIGSPDNAGADNMLFSQNVSLSLNGRATLKNNNVAVVGGSGSGKSRFFVKPNILQANCNYIITDPSGELLADTGHFLESQGYEIKIFNLVEMAKSDCYNPFDYIRDDLGVVMMVKCLIANTTPPGRKGGDPFWEKSEEALLQALCFYLIHHRPKKYHNFTTVMELLRAAVVDDANPNAKSSLDRMFDDVEKIDPTSIALKQYKTFKMGAEKTIKSILISCSVRLTVFNIKQIENLTCRDTIELEKMGEGKKALFVIIPSADSTYNFLVSMMYSQLFETLYYIAETKFRDKCLPRRVRFLLDEFANIGEIPDFEKKLSTLRKYGMSCSIILQNLAQLKTMYKDDWQTILGNCDSFLFLGGQEYETVEYISKELGDSTIVVRDRNFSHGKSKSSSQNYKATKRSLMTPDEVMRLPTDECILMIRALHPFKDKKYDYTKHPNYYLTADANPDHFYVNRKDNSEPVTIEKIHMEIDRANTQKYRDALENPSPNTKIIGDFKNVLGFAKTLNIKSGQEACERLTPVESPTSYSGVQLSLEDLMAPPTDGDKEPIAAKKNLPSTEEQEPEIFSPPERVVVDTSRDPEKMDPAVLEQYRQRPLRPLSEKAQIKRSRVPTPNLILSTSSESEAEVWDYDQ